MMLPALCLTLWLAVPATPDAVAALHKMPSPEEFLIVTTRTNAAVVAGELRKVNEAIAIFAKLDRNGQHAAIRRYVEDCTAGMKNLYERDELLGDFRRVAEFDCAKLDFLAMARDGVPAIHGHVRDYFRKGPYPSVVMAPGFQPRTNSSGFDWPSVVTDFLTWSGIVHSLVPHGKLDLPTEDPFPPLRNKLPAEGASSAFYVLPPP